MRFGIIGTGVVGTALAVRLEQVGYECVGATTRSESSYARFRKYLDRDFLSLEELVPQVDILFITTQDGMISTVAANLAKRGLFRPGQLWIHCSGSLRAQVLKTRPDLPLKYLSLHPLQAFANVDEALAILEGTHFGVEGEGEEEGEEIVRALGGIPHRLNSEYKALYHAGAVLASNYTVVLAALAERLFREAGIEPEEALESLLPLMKGTLHNLSKVKVPQALTGPIARGDTEVIKGHLAQLSPDIVPTYLDLGRHALELGREKLEMSGKEYLPGVWQELTEIFGTQRK
ncbi:Rossmann-like and DUF2520 domain-containing protein [Paradesulfitobacterium aromaticivorans]